MSLPFWNIFRFEKIWPRFAFEWVLWFVFWHTRLCTEVLGCSSPLEQQIVFNLSVKLGYWSTFFAFRHFVALYLFLLFGSIFWWILKCFFPHFLFSLSSSLLLFGSFSTSWSLFVFIVEFVTCKDSLCSFYGIWVVVAFRVFSKGFFHCFLKKKRS